jgi:hypothetical protein
MDTVIMRGQISGGWFVDNGDGTSTHQEYPGPGRPFRTDADTAARLIAQGMAVRPDRPTRGEEEQDPAGPEETPAEDSAPGSRNGRRR